MTDRLDPELAAVMAAMDAGEEPDRNAVLVACRRIGYGRVMQIASEAWRERDPSRSGAGVFVGPVSVHVTLGESLPFGKGRR